MYLQIMEQVRQRIAIGDWHPGRELPSIRALAAGLNISVITIKRAYEELETEGLIETHHGKGSFVAKRPVVNTNVHMEQLDEHLAAAARLALITGATEDDLIRRLRRAQRNLGKKI
jgi:GntR family transcriptional regulator